MFTEEVDTNEDYAISGFEEQVTDELAEIRELLQQHYEFLVKLDERVRYLEHQKSMALMNLADRLDNLEAKKRHPHWTDMPR